MDLIKVEERNGEQLVSARELYDFLEVKSRFNDWIENRISKYEFTENYDYTKILVECIRGQNKYDYILKLDMAKELSMVENNEKGRQARRYFIECEKRLQNQFKVPTSFADALKLAYEQQILIEEQKPKVEYFDKVLHPDKLVTTTEIAKDLGMSAVTLHSILHDLGIIYKKGKTWLLYEKYQKRVPEFCDYTISKYGQTLKWTEKGRKWVIELLKGE